MVLRSQSRMRAAKKRACDRICTSKSRGRGGIGIRSGLKIRRRKACGFESHRPYQVFCKPGTVYGVFRSVERKLGPFTRAPEGRVTIFKNASRKTVCAFVAFVGVGLSLDTTNCGCKFVKDECRCCATVAQFSSKTPVAGFRFGIPRLIRALRRDVRTLRFPCGTICQSMQAIQIKKAL